jgi:hypothetical protein
MKYRKIKYILQNFMSSLPPALPSLHPHSHAACLHQLVVMLHLVLRHLSFLSHHCLLSGSISTCPPLVAPLPLVVPLFVSGAVTSCPPRLFVVSPLVTPLPPICLRLRLLSHCCLSLCPSCTPCPAGCCIASHHVDASCPPAPPALDVQWLFVAPLSCLFVHSGWLLCSLFS